MRFAVFTLFLFLTMCFNSFGQNFKIGLSANLIGISSSEPFFINGQYQDQTTKGKIPQFGAVVYYQILNENKFSIWGSNKITYGAISNVYNNYLYVYDENRGAIEYELTADLDYIFAITQAMMGSVHVLNHLDLSFGINVKYHTYKFQEKLKNYSFQFESALGEKIKSTWNYGPIIQIEYNLFKNYNIIIGANYNFEDDTYHEVRIKSEMDPTTYYSVKEFSKFEGFINLVYCF